MSETLKIDEGLYEQLLGQEPSRDYIGRLSKLLKSSQTTGLVDRIKYLGNDLADELNGRLEEIGDYWVEPEE